MSPTPPISIPGYSYDPVKNRYFKSLPVLSAPNRSLAGSSRAENDQPKTERLKSTRRSGLTSLRPQYDPEMGPGTFADRMAYKLRIQSTCLRSERAEHCDLVSPVDEPTDSEDETAPTIVGSDEITSLGVIPFKNPKWRKDLAVGLRSGEVNFTNLSYYIRKLSSGWESPVREHDVDEPVTSIVSRNQIVGFGGPGGCSLHLRTPWYWHSPDYDSPTVHPERWELDFPVFNIWSLYLSRGHFFMGSHNGVVYTDTEGLSPLQFFRTGSSVFAIEEQDEKTFLIGTRSGKVMLYDMRLSTTQPRRVLVSKPGSVYHLKLVNEKQLLMVGSGDYAQIHDLRYAGRHQTEPVMNLSGHHNTCSQTLGFSVSSGNHNLVSMAGDDYMIKIWDLKAQPVSGSGLKPIFERKTGHAVKAVTFVDDWPHPRPTMHPGEQVELEQRHRSLKGLGLVYGDGSRIKFLGTIN